MQHIARLGAFGLSAALAACSATGEAQRPPIVTSAVGKVVEGLATETMQRQASEAFRGMPVVVRSAAVSGADGVIAEMLRTRLTERGVPVEVACPAKCMEVTLLEFVMDATAQSVPGQLLPTSAGTASGLEGLPRAPGSALSAGQATALLVTFAARDGNRYGGRQHMISVVAVARSPAPAR